MPLKNLEGQSREEIAKALPCALKTALKSYKNFMADEKTEDASTFKSHHDACKAAVAHIQLLTKLVEWVEAAKEEIADHTIMEQLIESAQEIKAYDGKDT